MDEDQRSRESQQTGAEAVGPRPSSEGTGPAPGRFSPEVPPGVAASPPSASHAPEAVYRHHRAAAQARGESLSQLSRRYSWGRVAVAAVVVVALAVFLVRGARLEPLWLVTAAVAFALFLLLSHRHRGVQRQQRRALLREHINDEGLARLGRRWSELPASAGELVTESYRENPPARARDLDIFGPASLARLLCTAATPFGRRALEALLLEPASAASIPHRQQAVEELAERFEMRQDLEIRTRGLAGTPSLDLFLRQAEAGPALRHRRWLRAWRWIGILLVWGLAAGWWWTGLSWHPFALAFLANIAIAYAPGPDGQHRFALLAESADRFALYGEVFQCLERAAAAAPFQAPPLARAQAALEASGASVSDEMKSLSRLADRANARLNAFHVVAQGLLLWDLHVLTALDRWHARAGGHAREWLEALGRVEAFAALATLRFEEPDWVMPEVDEGASSLEAEALAHPLLSASVRVANDVQVGPAGTVLLVTGSNMSGKSTLLRALGLATVLAGAGGPVSARRLRMPPLRVATSILVEDSLASGVSFFLAELYRLKGVVDAARESPPENGSPRLLYLLDEVLRGTNSAERRTAVETVVRHLLDNGALGAITTHDLQLGSAPGLITAAVPVHFRETIHSRDEAAEGGADGDGGGDADEVMTFDYQLRSGLATTTNALALLRRVGLDP